MKTSLHISKGSNRCFRGHLLHTHPFRCICLVQETPPPEEEEDNPGFDLSLALLSSTHRLPVKSPDSCREILKKDAPFPECLDHFLSNLECLFAHGCKTIYVKSTQVKYGIETMALIFLVLDARYNVQQKRLGKGQ